MKNTTEILKEINRTNTQFLYDKEHRYKLSKHLEEFYNKLIEEYTLAKFDESENNHYVHELLEKAYELVTPPSEYSSPINKKPGWVCEYDESGYTKKISDFIHFVGRQPEVFNIISDIVKNTIEKPLQRQISDKDKELNENKKEIDDLKQTVSETKDKLSGQDKKIKFIEAEAKAMKGLKENKDNTFVNKIMNVLGRNKINN